MNDNTALILIVLLFLLFDDDCQSNRNNARDFIRQSMCEAKP